MSSGSLLQISPKKRCLKKLRFFLNVFSECRKCYFRDPNFKTFLGKKNGPFDSFVPPLKNPQKMHWYIDMTLHDILEDIIFHVIYKIRSGYIYGPVNRLRQAIFTALSFLVHTHSHSRANIWTMYFRIKST
jgi:hypothetical protein